MPETVTKKVEVKSTVKSETVLPTNKPWFQNLPKQVYPPENKSSGLRRPGHVDIQKQVYPPENKPSGIKKPFQI